MRPCDSVSGTRCTRCVPPSNLNTRERAVALDLERVRAVGGVHRLGREAAPLGVAGEHAVQVARPQAGLLAARAAADLDDHVLVVVGVALDHREADLLLEALDPLARVVELRAQLGVLAALVEQLLRALGVRAREPPLLRELGGGRELVEQAAGVGVALAVPDHLGVRHLRLRVGEARLDLLDERLRSRRASLRAGARGAGGRPRGRPPDSRLALRLLAGVADVAALAAVDDDLAAGGSRVPFGARQVSVHASLIPVSVAGAGSRTSRCRCPSRRAAGRRPGRS